MSEKVLDLNRKVSDMDMYIRVVCADSAKGRDHRVYLVRPAVNEVDISSLCSGFNFEADAVGINILTLRILGAVLVEGRD
jgi:hypothetical protein